MTSLCKKKEAPPKRFNTVHGGNVSYNKQASKPFSKSQETEKSNTLATIDDQKSNWTLCRGQRERARNPTDTSSERSWKTFQDQVPRSGARPKTEVFSRYPKLSDATSSEKLAASKSDQILRERMRSTKKTSKGCSGTPFSAASEVKRSLIDDETLSALNLLPGCIKELEEPILLVPPDLPMAFEQKIVTFLNKEFPSSQSRFETDDYALIGGRIPLKEASFIDSDAVDFKAEARFFKDSVCAVDFSMGTHGDEEESTTHYNLPAIVPSTLHMDSSLCLTSLSASSDIEYTVSCVERQMPADETDISIKEEYHVGSAVEGQNFLSQMSLACCITRPKQSIACDAHEAGSLLYEREEKSAVSKKTSRSIRSWLDCSNSIDGLKTEPTVYNKVSPSLERDRKLVAFEQSKGDDMQEYGFLDFAKVFAIGQDEEPLYWPLDMITSTDNQSTIDSSSWLESMTDSISSSCDFSQWPSGEECITSVQPSADKLRAESYTAIRKENSKKESAVSFSDGCCTFMRKQKGDKEKTKDTKKNVSKTTTETWTRTPKLHPSVEENGGASKVSRLRNRENTQSLTDRNFLNGIQCQKDRLQKRSIVSSSQKVASSVKSSTSFSSRHAPSRCHSDVVLSSLTISDTELVSVEGCSNAGYVSSNCSYVAQNKDCSLERLSRELFDGASSHVKRSARANVHSTDIKNSVHCDNFFCPQFLPSNILDSTFAFGINDDLTGSSIETLVGMAEFDGREGMDKCSLLDMCPVIEKRTSQAVSCMVGSLGIIANGPPHTSIEDRGSAGTQWSLKDVNTEIPDVTRMLRTNLHGNKGEINGSFSFDFTKQAIGDMLKKNPLSSCTSANCENMLYSPINESTYTSTLNSEFSKNNSPIFWQVSEKDMEDHTENKDKEGFLALSLSTINKQNSMPQFQKQADCCQQSFSILNPLEVHDRCLKEGASCNKSLGFIQDHSFTVHDSKETVNCTESQETSANEFTATSFFNSSASCSVDSLVEVQARGEVSQKVIRSLVYNEDKRRVGASLNDAFPSCTTSSSSSSIIIPTRSITGGGSPLEKVEVFREYEPSSLAHQKSGKARGTEDRSIDTKSVIQDRVSPVNHKCSQKEWNDVEEVERSMSWKPFDCGCFAAKIDIDEDFQVDNILESELKCKCVKESMEDDLFASREFDTEENFLFVHNVNPNEDDVFLSSEIEQHICHRSRLEKPEFPEPEFQDFIIRGSYFALPFDCFLKQETLGMQASGKVGKNEFPFQKCVAKEIGLGIHLRGLNKVSQNPILLKNDIGSSVLIYKNPLWSEELTLNYEFHRRWHDTIPCELSFIWKGSEVLTDEDYGCNLSHVFLNDYFDIVVRIVDSSLQAFKPHNHPLLYSNPLSEDAGIFDATNDHGTSEINDTFELKDFSMCKFVGHIDVHTCVSSINGVLTKDCKEMNSLICHDASMGDIEDDAGTFAVKHEEEADQTMMCGCLIKEAKQLALFCDNF